MSKLQFCITVLIIVPSVLANNDTLIKINVLEKKKDDLFKKINEVIDINVGSLKNANESEALLAVRYLKTVKENINLNDSDIRDVTITSEEINDGDSFRRKAKTKKTRDDFINDLEKILKPKHVSDQKLKQIIDNREVIKKKLDDWILERQKEREKIRKYRWQAKYLQRTGKMEKCPRFGYTGRKKKKKEDYASCKKRYKEKYDRYCKPDRKTTIKVRRTPSSGRKKYPCCRKCCKKSYMGCL
ncbi:unnamed protein product [Leptosia nina]|uniref:Uncharacterized protein n=1 Tax=Leptosia nina TaxID=320188 RepID=A0AAV1JL54_9NEOP